MYAPFFKRFAASAWLRIVTAGLLITIGGCGGGGGASPEGTNGLPKAPDTSGQASAGSSSSTPSVPADRPPPSPIAGSAKLRLVTATGGDGLPFTVGYAFRQGDIPSGRFITASGGNLRGFQATVKNRWRDGSVKFAVLSGLLDMTANSEQTLSIGWTETGPSAPALGLGDLKATGVSASISYGSYGTATWSGNGWDTPFLSWISGPEMSSWLYRQPIGADQHLVAWLEVRLYRGGAVEIVPWIENGYLLRAAPSERSGTAVFSINGSARFNGDLTLYNHTRAVLGSGQTLSHWLGSDPQVSFRHDMGYLQLTGLVPAYRGVTAASARVFSRIVTSYTPLGQHEYPNGMGAGGYHPSIGPLPEWDVVYMTSDGDPRAWRAVQINGYAAGRYGFHFRDETTNRAPRFSSYPNLVLGSGAGISSSGASSKNQNTPNATGGVPPAFATSHMPSIGYMAYLVTGRWYFLDEMQLLSSAVFLKQPDIHRNFTDGIILSFSGANTTRGAAWALRALADAAAATPDDDEPLRSELVTSLERNIDWYYTRYVAQQSNPLGLAQPYSDYTPGDGKIDSAAWMEDFLTWSFGNMKSVQAHTAALDDKLDRFLAWKYRSIAGRFGPNQAGNWSYRRAASYTVPFAPSETVDWANGSGPWYPNWGAAYAAANYSYDAGTTLLDSYIDGDGLSTSYWGNLQPALAYAVEQDAAGAREGYDRMVSAPNWQSAAKWFDSDTPVWSVRPRNVPY